jgi:hypothetical protein
MKACGHSSDAGERDRLISFDCIEGFSLRLPAILHVSLKYQIPLVQVRGFKMHTRDISVLFALAMRPAYSLMGAILVAVRIIAGLQASRATT